MRVRIRLGPALGLGSRLGSAWGSVGLGLGKAAKPVAHICEEGECINSRKTCKHYIKKRETQEHVLC